MKKRKFTTRTRILHLLAFFFLIGQTGWCTTLVSWPLTSNNNSSTASLLVNRNLVFSSSLGTPNTNSSSGANLAGWNTSGSNWLTSEFSTTNYLRTYITAQMKSDATGPKNFQIQYKIGSGSWTNVGTVFNISSTQNSIGNIYLPAECSNQPKLTIRIINTDNVSVNEGSVNSTGVSYIKNLSINGDAPSRPSTQADGISLVSVTPTTITITVNTGSGSNWILKMAKNEGNFTDLEDNSNPNGNLVYNDNLGEEQVMANLSEEINTITVTVGSAVNEYWFRAYTYNYNDGMTRFLNDYGANDNPKFCALETIRFPTATNIRLTSANLGATISPPKGNIVERGIFWGLTSGISQSNTKIADDQTLDGAYSFNVGNLIRSSTIYYKGYVINESGMILSEESSFTNIPIFSGTGNWETDTQWNVLQVPGSGTTYGSILDKPTINGVCTLTSQTSCNSLIVNSGRKIIVSPFASLNVTTSILNSAGNSGILIESNGTDPSGSLIFNNSAGSPLSATVEMYSKAKWDLTKPSGSKYSWQFFGIPVKTLSLTPTFSGAFVRKWEESGQTDVDLWVMQNSGSTLSSITGYELVQSTAKTYSFAGQLENQGFTRSLPYSAGAVYPGQHIFGNPFTAAIDIEKIQFGANTENSIYLYNTGTYNEWDINSGETATGEGHGQYTVTTPMASGGLGIPSQIPSMQGFLVKSINATGSITIPYISSVANSDIQRIKANNKVANSEKVITRIDIKSTHYSDRMWIFTDPDCTRSFDNGWDGRKMLGSPQRIQLFSMEEDGNYQINAVRDITDTYIGFQPGDDREFKLIFTHQNITSTYSGIYLIDLKENKSMDITTSGSEYSFTSDPSAEITKRFKIITKTTEANNNQENNGLKLFLSNSALFVQNFSENDGNLILYKTTGATLKSVVLKANTVTTFSTTDLIPGIYLAKAFVDNKETTQRIIIR